MAERTRGGQAAIAPAAAELGALRHAPRTLIWSQAAVVGLTITVMAWTYAVGTSTEDQQRREACRAGLAAFWCADLR